MSRRGAFIALSVRRRDSRGMAALPAQSGIFLQVTCWQCAHQLLRVDLPGRQREGGWGLRETLHSQSSWSLGGALLERLSSVTLHHEYGLAAVSLRQRHPKLRIVHSQTS